MPHFRRYRIKCGMTGVWMENLVKLITPFIRLLCHRGRRKEKLPVKFMKVHAYIYVYRGERSAISLTTLRTSFQELPHLVRYDGRWVSIKIKYYLNASSSSNEALLFSSLYFTIIGQAMLNPSF